MLVMFNIRNAAQLNGVDVEFRILACSEDGEPEPGYFELIEKSETTDGYTLVEYPPDSLPEMLLNALDYVIHETAASRGFDKLCNVSLLYRQQVVH